MGFICAILYKNGPIRQQKTLLTLPRKKHALWALDQRRHITGLLNAESKLSIYIHTRGINVEVRGGIKKDYLRGLDETN